MSNLMPGNDNPGDDRRRELQVDRALFGLTPDEQREWEALAGNAGREHADLPDDFELAAAALDLALHDGSEYALPAHLRDRILSASRTPAIVTVDRPVPPSRAQSSGAPPSRRELAAWFVAAAALLAAAYLGTRTPAPSGVPTPAALRAQLLAKRDGAAPVQVAWTRGADETGANAEGDIVWSDAAQAGVMRFRGLAANDPQQNQYQLWIFDADRDDAHPVDGGVFDIPAGGGDVLVPIAAKLPVAQAKMFAITVERPGGVVVSDRSRLPLLAQVP